MPSTIIPKALAPGATIGFVSPSARLNTLARPVLDRAIGVLTERGYKVREFFTEDTSIQSSITNRLTELRAAFSDTEISAIICTIGGPSFTELLPALIADTELHATIRANPKIVVGYSDITGFHWFLYTMTGLRTFYGPGAIPELGEPAAADDETTPVGFCVKHLFRAISVTEPLGDLPRSAVYVPSLPPFTSDVSSTAEWPVAPAPAWKWLRGGKSQGRLFGGCLTVVARLHGVRPIVPDWKGRIVFLETAIAENHTSGTLLHRFRAGIADLIAYGVFEDVTGLVVGRAFGYNTEEQREQYAGVIRELLCEGRLANKTFPILLNVDIGHTTPLFTLPFDALAELDSERDRFAVLESAVA